jgi:hypothetical protein
MLGQLIPGQCLAACITDGNEGHSTQRERFVHARRIL